MNLPQKEEPGQGRGEEEEERGGESEARVSSTTVLGIWPHSIAGILDLATYMHVLVC